MAYSVLRKLESDGSLQKCSLLVSDKSSLSKARRVFGRDITRITLSFIEFLGGETGQEKLSFPLNKIQEIELKGRVVYKKKKRIERIYPRG